MTDYVIIYKRLDDNGISVCHPTEEALAERIVYFTPANECVQVGVVLERWLRLVLGADYTNVNDAVNLIVQRCVPTYRAYKFPNETEAEAKERLNCANLDDQLNWSIVDGFTVAEIAAKDVPTYRQYMIQDETEAEAKARLNCENLDINIPFEIKNKEILPDNRDSRDIWDHTEDGIIISDEKTQEILIPKIIAAIKNEARKRIDKILPDYKQRNYMAELMRYASDHFTLVEDSNSQDPGAPLPPMKQAHKDKFSEYGEIQDQIDFIRLKSNLLEASLENMNINELQELDINNNSHWS